MEIRCYFHYGNKAFKIKLFSSLFPIHCTKLAISLINIEHKRKLELTMKIYDSILNHHFKYNKNTASHTYNPVIILKALLKNKDMDSSNVQNHIQVYWL